MADVTKYRPCSADDQKAFMATRDVANQVKAMLKFPESTNIEIIAEAVGVTSAPDGSQKYLVMGGVDIEAGDDNREGYVYVKDGKVVKTVAVVLPTLS